MDDVLIISRNLQVLEEVLQELDKAAQELGLVTSQDKTKCMRVSKNSLNQCKQIAAGGCGGKHSLLFLI